MSEITQQVAVLLQSFVPIVPAGRIHICQDDQEDVCVCTKCHKTKAYEDFYYNQSKKERQYECKECVGEKQKRNRLAKKENKS